jgi:hypothetical protein
MRYQAPLAVTLEITVFWYMKPCRYILTFLRRNRMPPSPGYDTIIQDTCMDTVGKPIYIT